MLAAFVGPVARSHTAAVSQEGGECVLGQAWAPESNADTDSLLC